MIWVLIIPLLLVATAGLIVAALIMLGIIGGALYLLFWALIGMPLIVYRQYYPDK